MVVIHEHGRIGNRISADYGPVQDAALNGYVSQVGQNLARGTHRPDMPYSFRVVNATYVNAYAFPGGSIACTRGIMLSLENEAELAALLGHELGHVNARHTAQQMSKGMVTQTLVGGLAAVAGTQGSLYGQIASQIGSLGAGALLASYSRDNEREADALGMAYMVKAGYDPEGMVGLMDVLNRLSEHQPGAIELMFSTHPMSRERYDTAVRRAKSEYAASAGLSLQRERYMDKTAALRKQKPAIEQMQQGDKALAQKNLDAAVGHFSQALKLLPNDYTALVEMTSCRMMQKNYSDAISYANRAQQSYPQEARAWQLGGLAKLMAKQYSAAYTDLDTSEKKLPGNPGIIFFKGYAQEGMQHQKEAAAEYHRYLQIVTSGEQAQHAYQRLKQWGYYK